MLAFVSHTHADEWIAKALVDMIEGRYLIPGGELRCTSLAGYKLELGNAPEIVLKEELGAAQFVIGIVTASSLQSPWVISELGATWGLRKALGLMLFPGVGDTHIPTLFRNLVSVDLRSHGRGPHEFAPAQYTKQRLRFLLDELGSYTSWTPKVGSSPDELAQEFINEVCTYRPQLRARHLLVTREEMLDERAYGLRWAQIAEYAKDEIRIWGWSCMNVLDGNSRNIFQQWLNASEHRRLRILALDPDCVETSQLEFGPVCGVAEDTVVEDIRNAIANVKEWRDSGAVPADQIDILTTRLNLTFSGVAIDMGNDATTSNGVIQSEYYTYNFGANHLSNRPNLVVRRGPGYWVGQHRSVAAIFDSGTRA
jgi:hypothetical protein